MRKVRRTEDVRRTKFGVTRSRGGGWACRVCEYGMQIAQDLVSHLTDFGFYTEASEKHLEGLEC